MKPLSEDLRARIIEAYSGGDETYDTLAIRFKVGRATISRLLRRHREDGTIMPRPPGGGFPPRIGRDEEETLQRLVEENPDCTVEDLTTKWRRLTGGKISRSSMQRALHRIKMSFKKKTFRAKEKNTEANVRKAAAFTAATEKFLPSSLVFLDESGITTRHVPLRGWGPRDTRLHDERPGGHYDNVSMLGAVRSSGAVAFRTYVGAINGKSFRDFLVSALLPALEPGDVVVMDNHRVHHARFVRPLIESVDADVVYLPPYSPELNPIEHVWSVVKALARKARSATTEAVRKSARQAWRRLRSLDLQETFASCGYGIMQA